MKTRDAKAIINGAKEIIKNRLDDVLTAYLSKEAQIEAGCHNSPDFFGSDRHADLLAKRRELSIEHEKLTNALVAINMYL